VVSEADASGTPWGYARAVTRRSRRIRQRVQRFPPVVMDGALGAAIFAIGTTQAVLYQRYYPRSERPLALVLMSVACAGVALRRTRFWFSCCLVAGTAIV